jgi:hypothetical protein
LFERGLKRKQIAIPEINLSLKKYLEDNKPLESKPSLTDKPTYLHFGSIISVGDYKVFRIGHI